MATNARTGWLYAMALLGSSLGCAGPGQSTGGTQDDGGSLSEDGDGDGSGIGPDCTGLDCDDGDADIWEQSACDARCGTDAHATGCPCDLAIDNEPEVCYGGDPLTVDVGPCHGGLRMCTEAGRWTACVGQVLPT